MQTTEGCERLDPSVLAAARRLVFNELTKEFGTVPLGAAATFLNGTSYNKAYVHAGGARPLIRISNISDPSSQYLRTDETLPERFLVKPGDLLVSWSASFKSILWPGPAGYLNQHIFKVTENEGYFRRFIRHAIEASLEKMQEQVVGIGMMHLRRDAFLLHPIPRIPLGLQQEVADYLDAVERGDLRESKPSTSALGGAISTVRWLTNIALRLDEVCRLREDVEDCAAAYVVSHHLKLSGDRTRALGDVLALEEDAVSVRAENVYPQVGVRSFGAGLFKKGPLPGAATTYRAFNRLYPGAVVLSQVKGWEGAIAVASEEFDGWYVSPEYRTFRCRPSEALPGYLGPLVTSEWFWRKLSAATRGVGARRERTRPEQFLRVQIPMPPVAAQQEAIKLFERMRGVRALQKATGAELGSILPSVLNTVFKQQMRSP